METEPFTRTIEENEQASNATFIARARNISPAMAECLLVAVGGLEHDLTYDPLITRNRSLVRLQQILNIWEAAK